MILLSFWGPPSEVVRKNEDGSCVIKNISGDKIPVSKEEMKRCGYWIDEGVTIEEFYEEQRRWFEK